MPHNRPWFANTALALSCFLMLAAPVRAELSLAQRASRPLTKSRRYADTRFVATQGDRFTVHGHVHAFVGTNLWYGANLGADDASGDRPRLVRELDHLAQLGIRNLRIMASSEGPDSEPWRLAPAMQPQQGVYNSAVVHGLDFLLSEMGKRHMHAVMCLSNYWQWSGGLAQYLNWNGAGPIPYPPPSPQGEWYSYEAYTKQFYTNSKARAAFADHVRFIVSRTNSITKVKYADDPTIMTWELANEPAEGDDVPAFIDWIATSAHLIKTLDPNHLVISGSEGATTAQVQRIPAIDYATTHIWPQNAGWYDPLRAAETYPGALIRAQQALETQRLLMARIGRPLVLAEFGLARDAGRFDSSTPTTYRADFYQKLMGQVYAAARDHAGISGVAFWAWGGEGRPRSPGAYWRLGDAFVGDPAHEQQGWYSVYDDDESMLMNVAAYARKMDAIR